MIGERRYGGGSEGRSPSPPRLPPRSRDVNPPRHWRLSPNRRRGTEEYSGEAKTSRTRRNEKRDPFDDRVPRLSAFDDRERERFGGRRFRSPRGNEERFNFDRPMSLSNYGDGATGKYDSEIGAVRPGRRDHDSYRGDLSSMKLKWDHPVDGSRKSDHLSVKNYSSTRALLGVGDINVSSSGDKDYYMQSSYLDSSQAGLPASRYLDSTKPSSLKYESVGKSHSHSYSLARGRVDDIPVSNLTGGDGSGHMSYVSSQYLNADNDRYIRVRGVRDELHLESKDVLHDREDKYFEKKSSGFQDRYLGVGKSVESDIYKFKKEDNLQSSRGYANVDSGYSASSSHLKDYDPLPSGILREGFSGYSPSSELHMPSSDVIRHGSGVASQPISYDGYCEKKQNMLPTESGGQFGDTRSRSSLYVGLPEERQGDWSYAEFGRSKIDTISTRLNNVEDRDQHILRTDVLKRTVDAGSHKEQMEDDGLWDQYPYFQVQSTPDKFDLRGSLHVRSEDVDVLGNGSTRLNTGAEKYFGYGGVNTEKHDADIGGSQWSHFENSNSLRSRGYDPMFGRLDNSPRKKLPMADLSLVEPYERRLGDKHVRDDTLYGHDVGIRISADGNGSRRIYNQVDVDDEIDLVRLSKKPKSSRPGYENAWRVSGELGSDEPSFSEFHSHYSIKSHKSGSRDIKKRLGPIKKLHVSQRLVKKHKPSIKKRLAPAPPMRHGTLPWIKNMSSSIMMSDQNDPDRGVHDHDGDHLEHHLPLATPEPPEKSEEFKHLLQNAFFKFLKQINETPTKRKTYMDQGKVGILKCFACGRSVFFFVNCCHRRSYVSSLFH